VSATVMRGFYNVYRLLQAPGKRVFRLALCVAGKEHSATPGFNEHHTRCLIAGADPARLRRQNSEIDAVSRPSLTGNTLASTR